MEPSTSGGEPSPRGVSYKTIIEFTDKINGLKKMISDQEKINSYAQKKRTVDLLDLVDPAVNVEEGDRIITQYAWAIKQKEEVDKHLNQLGVAQEVLDIFYTGLDARCNESVDEIIKQKAPEPYQSKERERLREKYKQTIEEMPEEHLISAESVYESLDILYNNLMESVIEEKSRDPNYSKKQLKIFRKKLEAMPVPEFTEYIRRVLPRVKMGARTLKQKVVKKVKESVLNYIEYEKRREEGCPKEDDLHRIGVALKECHGPLYASLIEA